MGIDNNKFQPIIRRVQNINVQLSPTNIKPAKKTLSNLVKSRLPMMVTDYLNYGSTPDHGQ